MSTFSTMQRPQQDLSTSQQSRSYGHYIDSNPSSTHSSPRSFTSDLDNFYPSHHHHHNPPHSQTYPIPAGATVNPYIPAQQRRGHPLMQPSRSSSYSSYTAPVTLQVTTSTSSTQEHDPNERTARPGNAHLHAQFHRMLPAAAGASSSSALPSNSNGISEPSQPDDEEHHSVKPSTDYTSSTPGLSAGLSRPLKPIEQERLAHLDRLKFFLATAPSGWDQTSNNAKASQQASSSSGFPGPDFSYGPGPAQQQQQVYGNNGGAFSGLSMTLEPSYQHSPPHPALNRFLLPNQEFVTCVLWNGLYHITGTDIVRALVFRFEAFGRPVRNVKKFEEGVFSDLRNLKPGVDACLEEPKSPFLDLLFKYQCIRTQKKQKVFYWFSVPHDRLFLDALERDLKREKMGLEPTTQILGEPAISFTYDPKRSLYEQFSKAQGAREGEGELETAVRIAEDGNNASEARGGPDGSNMGMGTGNDTDNLMDESESEMEDPATGGESESDVQGQQSQRKRRSGVPNALGGPNGHAFSPLFDPLFGGSPTYKQRRKKVPRAGSLLRKGSEDVPGDYERGRSIGVVGSDRLSSLSRERRPIPIPMHPSMRHEFGAGSADEKARETEELSAADMFLKQAKGQLVPGDGVVRKPKPNYIAGDVSVVYHQDGSIQQRQQQQQQQGAAQHMRRASADTRIRDFTTEYASDQETRDGSMSAPFSTTTFDSVLQQQPGGGPGQMTGMSSQPYETVSADGKMRAFVCPLFSCGRLFKRMEHLKRHLRTHTMERPFTCHLCKKRFSRSDNLNQHLKTHDRPGHGPLSTSGTAEAPNAWVQDDPDMSGGEGSNHGGSPGHSIPDSEDEGLIPGMFGFTHSEVGMDMLGESPSLRLGQMDLSGYGFDVPGFGPHQLDENMCTVEVQGGLRDVQGDEEGEVMRMDGVDSSVIYSGLQHQSQLTGSDFNFSSQPSSAATTGLLFSSASNSTDYSDNGQWATRPAQPSPAFSATSAPSPPPGSTSLLRNNMRALQSQHSHSSSSSQSSNFGDDYSLASISAPSHKQSFDHATLFPPGVLDGAASSSSGGGNIGPVRRHRSMTPSIARSGEPIRRPVTANSSDLSGSPASVSSMHSNRAYHPYYSNNNSRANSTHNSPQVHPVPLGSGEYHRSESRNSNYGGGAGGGGAGGNGGGGVAGLHEQMRQMMSMDGPGGPASSTLFTDSVFRSGSPASFHQTESPATFSVDLPMQYSGSPAFGHQSLGQQQQQQSQQQSQQQQVLHAATMPAGAQYPSGQQQHPPFDGYYVQQPHATL